MQSRTALAALTALACALAAPGRAAADATLAPPAPLDAGPLGLRIQGTLRALFLEETGADARALEAPQVRLGYALSNIWNAPMRLHRHADLAGQELDEQSDVLDLSLRAPWTALFGEGPSAVLPGSARPLWARLSSALELRATEHWGGYTDPAIEAWHGLVGAFNFTREQYPRNRVHLKLADSGGTAFDIRGSTFALGDVVVRTQLLLAEGGVPLSSLHGAPMLDGAPSRYGLSLRLDVKLPLGSLSRAGGSGGLDAGLALLGTAELGESTTLHALLAVSRFSGFSAPLLQQPRRWQLTAEISAVFDVGPLQVLVEDRITSALLDPGWERFEQGGDNGFLASGYFASFRPHNQISWGLRRGPVSFWLSENFTPGSNPRSEISAYYKSNSPDVTVGASFTHSL